MLSNTEEFKEKELKMKEEHYRRMEDKQMVFDYHHAKEKNNKKPTAKERLTKSYESWAKANLTPNTKKEYLKDNIRREWEVSDEC